MNERIQQLAEQATKHNPAIGEFWTFDKEKFAELIVRECAKLADEPTSRPFESYGEKIKNHFGIE